MKLKYSDSECSIKVKISIPVGTGDEMIVPGDETGSDNVVTTMWYVKYKTFMVIEVELHLTSRVERCICLTFPMPISQPTFELQNVCSPGKLMSNTFK